MKSGTLHALPFEIHVLQNPTRAALPRESCDYNNLWESLRSRFQKEQTELKRRRLEQPQIRKKKKKANEGFERFLFIFGISLEI